MLLPLVLAPMSAASMQPTGNVAAAGAKQFSSDQNQAMDHSNNGQGFVHKFHDRSTIDDGMIVRQQPCRSDQECKTACLSITAYVYSDGEIPRRQYVTDCPNLEVPYQMERARRKHSGNDHRPSVRRTN